MSKIKNALLCLFGLSFFMPHAYAQHKDPDAYGLMTGRDMKSSALSNITITNRTSQPITVYGLFIVSFDINDCSSCFGNILAGDNMGGAMASPVTFKINQSVPIGQNYLYNMIYNGLYYVSTNIGTPCALPGCSWPGDNPTVKGWCVSINVASLNSSYTHSSFSNGTNPPAQVPPYGNAATSIGFDYNYDLINPTTLGTGNACLGPIKCDDKTLTCKVSTPQNQSFQPYA